MVSSTAVAVGTTSPMLARWAAGTATTPTAATITLVSVLSAPLSKFVTSVIHGSTAHEGGKPKCAVLLRPEREN